jgi:predicted DCC family thiol-disulfide oxidoreductase YuxK
MIIFDGDCGFCTKVARRIESRLRTPVPVVPWQSIGDLGELGLTVADVTTAMYWVDVYGRTYRGHRAAAQALRRCRGPLPVAGVLLSIPPLSWLGQVGYRVIARNRYRLPGATEACALPRTPAR